MENDLFVPERWDRVGAVLDQKGRVTVDELAELFDVSRSTIRRDLLEMHRRNLLVKTRGGAVRTRMVAFDRSLSESGEMNVQLKEKIGRAVAKLISPGETVMLDAGSTTEQVARNIQAAGITLVTNSLHGALAALPSQDIEVIMVGGMVRRHAGSMIGPTAEEQVRHFKADTAVMGVNGISLGEGLTTPNLLVAEVKKAMIGQARRLIVAADHTKLGEAALCKVAPLSAVSILVTDDAADPDFIASVRNTGVEVIVAH